MTTFLNRGLFGALLLVGSLAPAQASTVWNFTGTCTDCPDIGEGTLTVGTSSFTFSYVSDWISYTMTNPTVRTDSGSGWVIVSPTGFTITPSHRVLISQDNVAITSFGGPGNILTPGVFTQFMTFYSATNGDWETGAPNDFGINGVWTQGTVSGVPEPSTLGLAGGALLLALYRARRRSA